MFPVQTAVRYKIPLVVWGGHQGIEQVGMFSHEHEVEMSRRYRKDHDLMGFEADELLSIFDTLSEDDIWQYRYPDDCSLNSVGVRGIYLGNYVRWDPKAQHEQMVKQYGYLGSRFPRTFDTFDHVDCYNFMDLHDYLKYIKHGYSKVTDHACREIRHGRVTRQDALNLVRHYADQPLLHLDKFSEWLGINQNSLGFLVNHHKNKYKCTTSEDRRFTHELPQANSTLLKNDWIESNIENSLVNEEPTRYITVGKGWPNAVNEM